VTARADGVVVVKVYAYRDAAGLERRLAELGIPAHVSYLTAGLVCQSDQYQSADSPAKVLLLEDGSATRRDPRVLFELTIDKKAMLSGQSVIIEVSGTEQLDENGSNPVKADGSSRPTGVAISMRTAVADGPVKPCAPGKVPGFGDGPMPSPSASPSSPEPGNTP
jgi:hypothetical protein